MSNVLDDLEQYRKQKSQKFQRVADKAEEASKGKASFDDDRFWKPQMAKDGNGYAVVRFLPERPEENFPYVSYWSHGFKGPTGKWYIEKCRTSLEKKGGGSESDPVADYNNALWNTELKENQDQARKQKRRLHYVSNVLVIKYPANPENEGQVFLYKYGKKIFDRINSLMNPEYQGEERQDPFDLDKGRDFKIKIKTIVSGSNRFPNYDDSEWMSESPVADTTEEIAEVYSRVYALEEFVNPSSFKSYDELKARLDDVMGFDTSKNHQTDDMDNMVKSLPTPAPAPTSADSLTENKEEDEEDEEDDEALMKRLEALANG